MKFHQSFKSCLLLLCLLAIQFGLAQSGPTTTWTGAVNSDWNLNGNWDPKSPNRGSNVIINGCGNCPKLPLNTPNITIRSLTINGGRLDIANAEIEVTNGITITSANINSTNGWIQGPIWTNIEKSSFFGNIILQKSGGPVGRGEHNTWAGGNTFTGHTTIINSSTFGLQMANVKGDIYENVVEVNNSSSGNITIAGNNVTDNEYKKHTFFNNSNGGTITVGAGTGSQIKFAEVDFNNSSSNPIQIGTGSGSLVEFTGPVSIRNTNHRVYVATVGKCVFKNSLSVNNNSTNAQSGIFLGSGTTSEVVFTSSGLLQVGSQGFLNGELLLSNLTYENTSTLTALDLSAGTSTKLIIGPKVEFASEVSFKSPQLYLNSAVYKNGGTFTKTGTGDNSSMGGNVFQGARTTIVNSSNSNSLMLAAQAVPDRYESGETIFENTGKASLQVAAGSVGNVFLHKTIFKKTDGLITVAPTLATGAEFAEEVVFEGVYNAYNTIEAPGAGTITYRGNILVGTDVYFGRADQGKVILTGDQQDQTIDVPAAGISLPLIQFSNVEINKEGGKNVLANIRLQIYGNLSLQKGILAVEQDGQTVVNFLEESSVTGGSNLSYIHGMVAKKGNMNFTFPLGDLGKYRPISMGSIGLDILNPVITAQYFPQQQMLATKAIPQLSINNCEYWKLSASEDLAMFLTLHTENSCDPNAASSSRIAYLYNNQWDALAGTINGSTVNSESDLYLPADGAQYVTLGYWDQITINTTRMQPASYTIKGSNVDINNLISGSPNSITNVFPMLTNGATDELQLAIAGSQQNEPLTLAFMAGGTTMSAVKLVNGTAREALKTDYYEALAGDLYLGTILTFYKSKQEKQKANTLAFKTNLDKGTLWPSTGKLQIEGLPATQARLDIYAPDKNLFDSVLSGTASVITWAPQPQQALFNGVYSFELTITNADQSEKKYYGQFIKK